MKIQILSLLALIACSSVQSKSDPVVFVHGAHFSGDSFKGLVAMFPSKSVHVVDLPNDEDTAHRVTLTDYANKVCDKLKGVSGKAVLVGHSQGGAVINHALGMCPDKIKAMVYVAATIPLPGEKPFELFGPADDEYYFKAIQEDKKRGVFAITDKAAFVDAFIQDGSQDQKDLALAASHDEPILPSATKLNFSIDDLQAIEKLVLLTTEDRVISLATQKKYAQRLSMATMRSIQSGHLPMITKQSELFQEITDFLFRIK